MQSKVRTTVLLLTFVSITNCFKFNYNAILSLGLFYWISMDKTLFAVSNAIRVLVALTVVVDIVYLAITIRWMVNAEKDQYLRKISGLNMYGVVFTIFEIVLKFVLLARLVLAEREKNVKENQQHERLN